MNQGLALAALRRTLLEKQAVTIGSFYGKLTPEQVRAKKLEQKKKSRQFPWLPMIGAALTAGEGASLLGTGMGLHRFGNATFGDVHRWMQNPRVEATGRKYLPEALVGKPPTDAERTQTGLRATPVAPPEARLRDYDASQWPRIDDAVYDVFNAPDMLQSQLHYVRAANHMLRSPMYGPKGMGIAMQAWLRHPDNWWRGMAFGDKGPYWGEDVWQGQADTPTQGEPGEAGAIYGPKEAPYPNWKAPGGALAHYSGFAGLRQDPGADGLSYEDVLRKPLAERFDPMGPYFGGYSQLLKENTTSMHDWMPRIAKIRAGVLSDIATGQFPVDQYRAQFAERLSKELATDTWGVAGMTPLPRDPQGRPQMGSMAVTQQLLGKITAAPVVRDKMRATSERLIDMMEQRMPARFRAQTMFGQHPGGFKDMSVLRSYLDAQEPAVRTAFNINNPEDAAARAEELRTAMREIVQKAGPDADPKQVMLQAYQALKDNPHAQLHAAVGGHNVSYPPAMLYYRTLSKWLSAPGQAAQAAYKAAPWVTGAGAALAAGGTAYGAYKLYHYIKAKRQQREEEESKRRRAEARQSRTAQPADEGDPVLQKAASLSDLMAQRMRALLSKQATFDAPGESAKPLNRETARTMNTTVQPRLGQSVTGLTNPALAGRVSRITAPRSQRLVLHGSV